MFIGINMKAIRYDTEVYIVTISASKVNQARISRKILG